ncbi:MAG: hypothetical protein HY904_13555 [Deltaproteobacteria bacterium]|nr:hypothetical protein [Deltaproteobacteria bacterium]
METGKLVQLILAVTLLLGGTGAYGFVVYQETVASKGNERKMAAPGLGAFTLDEGGTWSIYWEYTGAPPSRINPIPMPELACKVTDAAGAAAPVRNAAQSTYRIGGTTGIELLEFDVTAPGEHRFDCELKSPYPRAPVLSLNIGNSIIGKSLKAVALPSVVYLVAMGLAAWLLVRALKPRR